MLIYELERETRKLEHKNLRANDIQPCADFMSYLQEDEIPYFLETDKYGEKIDWIDIKNKSKNSQSTIWKSRSFLEIRDPTTSKILETVELIIHLVKFDGGFAMGLNLLYQQQYIERGDYKPRKKHHINPDKKIIQQGHKHKITDEHQDSIAFVPDDVKWTSPNRILQDVLKEWNINFEAKPDIPAEYYQQKITEAD